MSLKNITININSASETVQSLRIAGGEGGAGARGQGVRIKALANVKYHFTDEATGYGPENMATKRVGKNLHIAFEGGDVNQPDLVIEDYYKDNGEIGYGEGSDNLLVGTHENGNVYPYVPESAVSTDAVSMLADGVQAGQALGTSVAPVPLWWLPLLLIPALAAGGDGGTTPPPVPPTIDIPDLNGAAPGQNTVREDKTVEGHFTIKAPEGLTSIVVAGTTVTKAQLEALGTSPVTVATSQGDIKLTGYDPATGKITYLYDPAGLSKDHSAGDDKVLDTITLQVIDGKGGSVSGDLVVQITDTEPQAHPDAVQLAKDAASISGNVVEGGLPGEQADEKNPDAPVQVVSVTDKDGNAVAVPADGTVVVQGKYGELTIGKDGAYTYTRTPGSAGGQDDVFTYTIKDGDGDEKSTTLTIKIGNSTPTVGEEEPNPDDPNGTPIYVIADGQVNEAGLPARTDEPAGSDADSDSETTTSQFIFASADGLAAVTLGGKAVAEGTDFAADPLVEDDTGKLWAYYTYDKATGQGVVHYKYTLKDNTLTDPSSVDFAVKVTDQDGQSASNTLKVVIVDDVPTAKPDTATLTEDQTITNGSVYTNDVFGADGKDAAGGVVGVKTGSDTSTPATGNVGTSLKGTYGTLKLDANGTYTYTPDAEAQKLNNGDSRTDEFVYTIKDGDGDLSTTTLVITVRGVDDPPTDFVPLKSVTVSEEGLPGGIKDNVGVPSDTTNEVKVTVTDGIKFKDVDNVAADFKVFFTEPTGVYKSDNVEIVWDISVPNQITGRAGSATGPEVIVIKVGTITADSSVANGFKADYTVELKKAIDHSGEGVEDVSDLVFGLKVSDGQHESALQSLTVTVEDDSPFATPVYETVGVANKFYANVMISLDVSGSMADIVKITNPDGSIESVTRLEASKRAIKFMLDQYQSNLDSTIANGGEGEVKVSLSTFAGSATQRSAGWITLAEAKAFIDSYGAAGSTNYDAALQELIDSFSQTHDALGNVYGQPVAVSKDPVNISYMLTDGEPTASNGGQVGISPGNFPGFVAGGNTDVGQADWEAFLRGDLPIAAGRKTISYAIGMGSGVSANALNPIAYNGVTGQDDNSLVKIVSDMNDLASVLAATTPVPQGVDSSLLKGYLPGAGFGADGGYVTKVVVNGQTYIWNGTTMSGSGGTWSSPSTGVLKVLGTSGGWLTLTMAQGGESGDFSFEPPKTVLNHDPEVVSFVFIDKDGDTAASNLVIDLSALPIAGATYSGTLLDNTKTGFGVVDIMDGQAGNDTLSGGAGNDILYGGLGNDTLNGDAGNDKLYGGLGNDSLNGGNGDDYLVGGQGNDTLTGGAGADKFVFAAPLHSTNNLDTVVDFSSAEGDKLVLSALFFEGLKAGDPVKLVVNGPATDGSPTVLYNSNTGMLSYDADGNGAGGAVDFAKLQNLAPLNSGDFVVI
ncbi:Ig-like domain-containing protein [Brachymonas denitrificans]|uniref:Ig-like domain-containing protein n=1 Tax=Brachymonas denitrificans TaxID=28220 RepID=UPI001BCC3288|nr:VCBS domain-containing protein [Brachymonas denitrificans]